MEVPGSPTVSRQLVRHSILASGRHLFDTKSEASAQPLPMHPALKEGLLEWRSKQSLQQTRRLRFPPGETQGSQATRLGCGAEEEYSACVREDRHHRRRLAYVLAHSRDDARGDEITPVHNSRLLVA